MKQIIELYTIQELEATFDLLCDIETETNENHQKLKNIVQELIIQKKKPIK